MPHGITQEQVNQAADAIIAAGERPTVEKIRNHLGTGSPNTVTRMLDTWRQGLAERLREANQLPDLPDEVGQAMTATWTLAMQYAHDHAQSELKREHETLEQAKAALDTRSSEQTALLATAQADAAKSAEAARQATVQAETLRRLVDRLEADVRERAQQIDQLTAQIQASAATEAGLRDRIQIREEKLAQERSKWEQHIQTVEDRAHTQVDRARTDLKAVRVELADTRKQHQKESRQLQQQVVELTRLLGVAEREVAHQRGIAEALKLKLSSSTGAKARQRHGNTNRTQARRQKGLRGSGKKS